MLKQRFLAVASLTLLGAVSVFAQQNQPPRQDPSMAVGGLLVSPTIYREYIPSGPRTGTLRMKVENPMNALAQRTIGELDILSFMPEPGTYKSNLRVNHPRDCSTWFERRSENVELDPGGRTELVLRYSVPRDAEGVYWAMIQFRPRPVAATQGAQVIYEIPIIFQVRRPARPVIEFTSPQLIPFTGMPGRYGASIRMNNIGTSFTPVGMVATLRSTDNNRVVAEASIEDRNLLPGTMRDLAVAFNDVPDGRYRLTVRVDQGARRVAPMSSEYVIQGGRVQLASEVTTKRQIPLLIDTRQRQMPDTSPGGVRVQTLTITNQSDRPMSLSIRARNVDQSPTGSIGIGEGDPPRGIEINVRPETVTVAPGRPTVVAVTLRLDREATGQYWYGIEVIDRSDAQGLSESIIGMVPVTNRQTPSMQVVEPEVVTDSNGRPVAVKFVAVNDGNMALQPRPIAAVLEGGVRNIANLEVPQKGDGGILPGVRIPNSVLLPPDLPPGEYTVEIRYQYAEDRAGRLAVNIRVPDTRR